MPLNKYTFIYKLLFMAVLVRLFSLKDFRNCHNVHETRRWSILKIVRRIIIWCVYLSHVYVIIIHAVLAHVHVKSERMTFSLFCLENCYHVIKLHITFTHFNMNIFVTYSFFVCLWENWHHSNLIWYVYLSSMNVVITYILTIFITCKSGHHLYMLYFGIHSNKVCKLYLGMCIYIVWKLNYKIRTFKICIYISISFSHVLHC